MREAMQSTIDSLHLMLNNQHLPVPPFNAFAVRFAIDKLEAALAAPESKSNTMAGFRGGFIGLHGRAPTEQEIWNAGVDSGRRRYAAPVAGRVISDAEIVQLSEDAGVHCFTDDHRVRSVAFARAIIAKVEGK